MRPIDRGTAPRTFEKYQDAAPDLMDRLGEYCSYCERRIPASLAVEHVQPKSLEPSLRNSWENFLLGCSNCNSIKGHAQVTPQIYLWPDTDNTHLAFDYRRVPGAVMTTGYELERSNSTIDLVGLDRVPGHPNPAKRATSADRRWKHRLEAFEEATRSATILKADDREEVRKLIVSLAKFTGFFSIWISVFQDDPDMVNRLIGIFPGTSATAFDASGRPVAR